MAGVGGDTREAAAWVRGTAVHEALVAALDDWAACARQRQRRDWLLEVARRADPDPWRDRVRDPAAWDDPAALAGLAQGAHADRLTPQLLALLGWRLKAVGGDWEGLLRQAHGRYPGDFWVNFDLGLALETGKKPAEAVGFYRAALAVRPNSAGVHNNLGNALSAQGKLQEAAAEFLRAIALDSRYASAYHSLGAALHEQGMVNEAIVLYLKLIALDPKDAPVHNNLGNALSTQGKAQDAAAEYRRAIDLDPNYGRPHYNLGLILEGRGQLDKAAVEYRLASELEPHDGTALNNLGRILGRRGKPDEAIAAFRQAISRDPKLAEPHINLGVALRQQGKLDVATAEYRRAIALGFKGAPVYLNLGNCLRDRGKLGEALAAYRKAADIDPKSVAAHVGLGNILRDQGCLGEAVAAYRVALAINPKEPLAHLNLGLALREQKKSDEAIAELRTAIELDGTLFPANDVLLSLLLQRGRFDEARQLTQRWFQLLPAGHRDRQTALQHLQRCDEMLALDCKLAPVLKGEARPADGVEGVKLAQVCTSKGRHVDATRLYAEAFAAQPGPADNLGASHRYNAARAAALAAAGTGAGADALDTAKRAHLRRQALAWLRADLAPRAGRADARDVLRRWQQDQDLTGLREEAALANLPDAERAEWRRLWSDVATLLEKAGAKGVTSK
jgi:tetratricopeptide (TPR) repeat protein